MSAPNRVLASQVDPSSDSFRAARAAMAQLVDALRADDAKIALGGGPKAIERQHEKKRLTARERIAKLIDAGTEFFELSSFAAWGMYEEWGTPAAAGVVTGIARVHGRLFMIVANDATVKAGAFFPITCKKVLRAQRIALDNYLPLLYLVDSAGVFLPLQDEVFPDEDDFGRVFRNNAVLSARGVPQIAAIMGMCVAGGAYLPVMCDTLLMTEGSGLFLAGPALVKAAIGQTTPAEELGGAAMHAEISGTVDFKEPDDESCLARMRAIVDKMGERPRAPSAGIPGVIPAVIPAVIHRSAARPPLFDPAELAGIVSPDPGKQYDVRDVIARIVDGSEFDEYRADYGPTLVCGFARIGGFAIGIVANQKTHVRRPGHPVEFGGVIYKECAEKAARFVLDCGQNRIPLLFLHDVNGFMVGKESERGGIIRAGAKMVNAVSNVPVPKISVILGGSFGAGHYAMCGKAYDPRFLFVWPTARYSVMGGAQAAGTLVDLRVQQLEKSGKKLSKKELDALRADVEARYAAALDPRYAAARLWCDKILEPEKTREAVVLALEVAALHPGAAELRTGVYPS